MTKASQSKEFKAKVHTLDGKIHVQIMLTSPGYQCTQHGHRNIHFNTYMYSKQYIYSIGKKGVSLDNLSSFNNHPNLLNYTDLYNISQKFSKSISKSLHRVQICKQVSKTNFSLSLQSS